jgi:prevent-host-death family protein
MKERSIDIRELKAKLSECVRDVKRGGSVVVTERGRRVARLVPEGDSLDDRLAVLTKAGAVLWSGRRLGRAASRVRRRAKQTLADIVVENRE